MQSVTSVRLTSSNERSGAQSGSDQGLVTCHVSWLLVRNARSCFVLLLANAPIALTSRGLWIGRCFDCYLWSVGILRRLSSLLASCQWKCVVSCCVSSQLRLALIDRTPRFGMRRTVQIQEVLQLSRRVLIIRISGSLKSCSWESRSPPVNAFALMHFFVQCVLSYNSHREYFTQQWTPFTWRPDAWNALTGLSVPPLSCAVLFFITSSCGMILALFILDFSKPWSS